MMDLNAPIRTGRQHLEAIREHEESFSRFVEEIAKATPTPDTPEILDSLGTALGYINQIATCDWGCTESSAPHVRRHLIGRAASNLQAGLLLLSSGYIPEAITCYRSAMEVADLVYLFWLSPESLQEFIESSQSKRNKKFSAGRVRLRLEKLGKSSLMEQEEYKTLSRIYVHPVTNPIALFLGNRTSSQPNISNAKGHVLPVLLYFNLVALLLLTSGMDLLQVDEQESTLAQIILKLREAAESYRVMLQDQN